MLFKHFFPVTVGSVCIRCLWLWASTSTQVLNIPQSICIHLVICGDCTSTFHTSAFGNPLSLCMTETRLLWQHHTTFETWIAETGLLHIENLLELVWGRDWTSACWHTGFMQGSNSIMLSAHLENLGGSGKENVILHLNKLLNKLLCCRHSSASAIVNCANSHTFGHYDPWQLTSIYPFIHLLSILTIHSWHHM